ncbi:hypothetical protein [Patulibacter defluvii]|uniref:hypothetical protein n=1 Tax=Patulibacter defluvii TaxID=3095358 RepID=UPI002A761702|nr:hypothetical protein [Patulibacter sp. DM4]
MDADQARAGAAPTAIEGWADARGRRRPPGAAAGLTVASVAAALALAACGGDDRGDDAARATAAEGQPPAVTAVAAENLSPRGLPAVPVLRHAKGARADVRPGRCPTDRGRAVVRGTVANPTDRPADYVIAVSWISDRSDVRARAVATVERVAPGATERWAARTRVRAGNAVRRTFFVQRGALRD